VNSFVNLDINMKMERKPKDPDVKVSNTTKLIPDKQCDPERRSFRKIMKSIQAPYAKFSSYYPFEEGID
jgi:hypothetical protein